MQLDSPAYPAMIPVLTSGNPACAGSSAEYKSRCGNRSLLLPRRIGGYFHDFHEVSTSRRHREVLAEGFIVEAVILILVCVLFVGGICSFLSYHISKTTLGAVVGFILGPLGVLIACFIKRDFEFTSAFGERTSTRQTMPIESFNGPLRKSDMRPPVVAVLVAAVALSFGVGALMLGVTNAANGQINDIELVEGG